MTIFSESIRTVGAQEAVDHLLNNSLIYRFAQIHNIYYHFLLNHEEALTAKEKLVLQMEKASTSSIHSSTQERLQELDDDNMVSVRPESINRTTALERRKLAPHQNGIVPRTLKEYMQRPRSLEQLTATDF